MSSYSSLVAYDLLAFTFFFTFNFKSDKGKERRRDRCEKVKGRDRERGEERELTNKGGNDRSRRKSLLLFS